jgi:hypothetical protein
MATNVKPTTKNSPSVRTGHARNNKPAEAYEKNGTSVAAGEAPMKDGVYSYEKSARDARISDPIKGGVSYGSSVEVTDGIETRGNGAATKGRKARGPMA